MILTLVSLVFVKLVTIIFKKIAKNTTQDMVTWFLIDCRQEKRQHILSLDFNFLKCSCQPFYNQIINSNAVLYVCIYHKLFKICALNLSYTVCLK
jgi:hypothetical protein